MSRGRGPRPHSGHRKHRRRWSAGHRPPGVSVVRWRSIGETVDELIDGTMANLATARRMFPGVDYAARMYFCEGCRSLNGAVAPRQELGDEYPCPVCHATSTAMVPVAP